MTAPAVEPLTHLLVDAAAGKPQAAAELLSLVYQSLKDIARQRMARERPDHTLQTTALVNECYIRLFGDSALHFAGRAQFFCAAAEAMRRILVEHARGKGRVKRGGKMKIQSLGDCDVAIHSKPEEILAIDEAICRLEQRDATAGKVVRLRFYTGLSVEETAAALGLSVSTVMREWAFARACLFRELTEAEP